MYVFVCLIIIHLVIHVFMCLIVCLCLFVYSRFLSCHRLYYRNMPFVLLKKIKAGVPLQSRETLHCTTLKSIFSWHHDLLWALLRLLIRSVYCLYWIINSYKQQILLPAVLWYVYLESRKRKLRLWLWTLDTAVTDWPLLALLKLSNSGKYVGYEQVAARISRSCA